MSALPAISNLAPQSVQLDAAVEMEQRLIGWLLKGAPGVEEVAMVELRNDAASFQAPYDRLLQAILAECEGERTVSVRTIALLRADCAGLKGIGGLGHLQDLADASPAVVSTEDGRKQAMAAIRTWRRLQSPMPKPGDVELTCADAVTPARVNWIWPGWLATGKFHLIAGSPGTGKTTLSLGMAATITNGGLFPCGSRSEIGSVLMWTGEDDLADSIVPRFLACGGNRSKLRFVSGTRDDDGGIMPFDPALDLPGLIAAARGIKDLQLLIIDPVVSAVSGDSHKNSETRRALQPLVDFAAEAGVAVLGITHYSKGTSGRDPAERVTGSLAFTAVPRLVMATAKPKEPGDHWRLVRAKSNIGPDGGGFEYDLQRVTIDEDQDIQGQCVIWGDVLEGSAQALLAEIEAPETEADPSSKDAAEAWLVEKLRNNGEARATFLQDAAKREGHSWATLRRAKKDLGIVSRNDGKGGWWWCWDKVLKPELDAHLKNNEHLSTCSTREHLSTCSDAQLNGVSTFPETVSTLSSSEVIQ